MKKINAIAWLITMLMTMVTSTAFATSGVNYSVEIGSGPTTLEVFPTPQTMKVGEKKWVYAKQTGSIGGTYFYSEDTSIATVTFGELASSYSYTTAAEITAKKPGKVNIVAKNVNGLTAICEVTISAQPVISVSLDNVPLMEVGETRTLTPIITPSDAVTTFTWDSDNKSVATVSQAGVVTAKSAGTAKITVGTDNGKTATCEVTVKEQDPIEYVFNFSIYGYENGKVLYNGSPLAGMPLEAYGSFKVQEGSNVALTILPDEGYRIERVQVDGTDVLNQLVKNVLTIPNILKDKSLIVSFEKNDIEPIDTVSDLKLDVSLPTIETFVGEQCLLPVVLANEGAITAFQMDLYLPKGLSIDRDDNDYPLIELTERASKTHSLSCNTMEDGAIRIICYSPKNDRFAGNEGAILNIHLNIGDSLADENYNVSIKNMEFSDNNGVARQIANINSVLVVKSFMLGDVDRNWKHTINDAVGIINYILGQPNDTFIQAAADVDGNGNISINDVVQLIIKYLLGSSTTSKCNKYAQESMKFQAESNYLYFEGQKMQAGEIRTIKVMMNNDRDDIRGMQCDITLPEGISFLYDENAEDYVTASSRIPKKFSLSSEIQNENTLRVAGVCTGSSSIYGNTGSVFTFKVKADENIMAGAYEILLSNVELSYGEAIGVADRSSVLEILDEANSIATIVSNGESNSKVYDLSGRRIDKALTKKGIYIINGKKVLIK